MADAKILTLKEEEYDSILTHWGFRSCDYIKDLPVNQDFHGSDIDQFGFYYLKTFKIQYLVYKELGAEN